MPLITFGDFSDLIYKIKTRGWVYFKSKLTFNEKSKIKSTWNVENCNSANWWIIQEVRKRWNFLISGDESIDLQKYITNKYLKNQNNVKVLSPACGSGSKEINLAKYPNYKLIEAFDISQVLIKEANREKENKGLENIHFFVEDFYNFSFKENSYDLVLFISSLHHFNNIESVMINIHSSLKTDGYLIIMEYVGPNRFQFDKERHRYMNKVLRTEIPDVYKKKYITNTQKRNVTRIGKLRMILSDPSEAPCSEDILPTIGKYFTKCEEKNIGGNLLAFILKDIAHNFINDDAETKMVLKKLFEIEDKYLIDKPSDLVFGVYKKTK